MSLKIVGAVTILIIGLSCGTGKESTPEPLVARTSPVQVGEMAPDFTLEDQNHQKVSLSAARGTPTVLVFYRGYW